MNPKLLLRIAAVLVLLNAIGHTIVHFTRKEIDDPVIKDVINQMEIHQFKFGGSVCSLDGFLTGNSLATAITLFVMAALLWVLSGVSVKDARICATVLTPLLFIFIGFTITSALYFFIVPLLMQG